MNTTKAGE